MGRKLCQATLTIRMSSRPNGQPTVALTVVVWVAAAPVVVRHGAATQSRRDVASRHSGGTSTICYLREKDRTLPILATTNPAIANTPREDAGVLGVPGTEVAFGGGAFDDQTRDGVRINFGGWWDQATIQGIGFSYLSVGNTTHRFDADVNNFPILGRPFFNALDDVNDALLINFPGEFAGRMSVEASSELQGAEVFSRRLFRQGCNYRVDLLVGYRYTEFEDRLLINDSFEFLQAQNLIPAGTQVVNEDRFNVDNVFHGGQIGVWAQSRSGNWAMDVITKFALGRMNYDGSIQGSTTTTSPGASPATVVGGLLTQRSNIGTFDDSDLAFVPEVTVRIGYQITPYIDMAVGYTFLYWSKFVQTGDLIDSTVDLTQQVGSPTAENRPALVLRDTDFWLQGLTLGINFRF